MFSVQTPRLTGLSEKHDQQQQLQLVEERLEQQRFERGRSDSPQKAQKGEKREEKGEEGKEAEDALLQINVRLAVVVNDDEEDTMQKNPETKDSYSSYSSQRRRSVVASIFLIDN